MELYDLHCDSFSFDQMRKKNKNISQDQEKVYASLKAHQLKVMYLFDQVHQSERNLN